MNSDRQLANLIDELLIIKGGPGSGRKPGGGQGGKEGFRNVNRRPAAPKQNQNGRAKFSRSDMDRFKFEDKVKAVQSGQLKREDVQKELERVNRKVKGDDADTGGFTLAQLKATQGMLEALIAEADKKGQPVAKADHSTGAMVALYLPAQVGKKFVLAGHPKGLPLSELHVTLGYLGKADELTPNDIEAAHEIVGMVAENHPPLTGAINGAGRFCNGDEGGDPFFIIPDLPDLPNLRQIIFDFLRAADLPIARDHGFTPHITLAYLPHDHNNPYTSIERTPVTFPTISLVIGPERTDYQLGGTQALKAALLVAKGGPTSGNWGHTSSGRQGKHGGSDRGGGHGKVGAKKGSSRKEIVAASKKVRQARPKKAAKPKGGGGGSIEGLSKPELNMAFNDAGSHRDRVRIAEKLLEDFSDNTIAQSAKEIPQSDKGLLSPQGIATQGKNAIYKETGGQIGFGKVLQNSDGDYFNANFGRKQKVEPIFESKGTKRTGGGADFVKNPDKLPPKERAGLLFAYRRPRDGVLLREGKSEEPLRELEAAGLGEIRQDRKFKNQQRFHINAQGQQATINLIDNDTDAAVSLFDRRTNEAARYYKERVGSISNNPDDRIRMAENSLKVLGRKDTKIRDNPDDIPSVTGALSRDKVNKTGVNAVFKDKAGRVFETGRMVERDGQYFAVPKTRVVEVDPLFRRKGTKAKKGVELPERSRQALEKTNMRPKGTKGTFKPKTAPGSRERQQEIVASELTQELQDRFVSPRQKDLQAKWEAANKRGDNRAKRIHSKALSKVIQDDFNRALHMADEIPIFSGSKQGARTENIIGDQSRFGFARPQNRKEKEARKGFKPQRLATKAPPASKSPATSIMSNLPENLGLTDTKRRNKIITDLSNLSISQLTDAVSKANKDLDTPTSDLDLRNKMIRLNWLTEASKRAQKRATRRATKKGDLTEKAQNDAPNYMAASGQRRCDNCIFFLGDPGRDWCEKFNFTADPDYVCDAWEAQKPDLIPGYMANKAQLAGVMGAVLRTRHNNLT